MRTVGHATARVPTFRGDALTKFAQKEEFIVHLLDQLAPLGDVAARRMFGANCLFLNGRAFGIVDEGTLYFKVSDETKATFDDAGGLPFTYLHQESGRRVAMSYCTIPEGDVDDRQALLGWGRLAARASQSVPLKKAAAREAARVKKAAKEASANAAVLKKKAAKKRPTTEATLKKKASKKEVSMKEVSMKKVSTKKVSTKKARANS